MGIRKAAKAKSPARGAIIWPMAQAMGTRNGAKAQKPRRGGILVAHTYTNLLIHALFSTKSRHPWLTAEVREELFSYLGGTVNKLGGQSVLVNGTEDHVHMLLVQPPALSLADLMEKVKANSSGWVKKRWPGRKAFAWQSGYTAFSVSKSHAGQVKKYIANQQEHHRKLSFQEEVLAFLERHAIPYDRRFVLDEDDAPGGAQFSNEMIHPHG